jgi:hypothetical protein
LVARAARDAQSLILTANIILQDIIADEICQVNEFYFLSEIVNLRNRFEEIYQSHCQIKSLCL